MFLDPVVQARVRQILGLAGAPAVDAIEAVQPTALVSAARHPEQPQLEAGLGLVRSWSASITQAAVALEFGRASIRTTAASNLLWCTRIIITNDSVGNINYVYGRAANADYLHSAFGSAVFHDMRLSGGDIGGAELVEIGTDTDNVDPVTNMNGPIRLRLRPSETLIIPVDFVLISGTAECLGVGCRVLEEILTVTFEGIAFSRP